MRIKQIESRKTNDATYNKLLFFYSKGTHDFFFEKTDYICIVRLIPVLRASFYSFTHKKSREF